MSTALLAVTASHGKALWYLTRSTGLVALVLLTGTVWSAQTISNLVAATNSRMPTTATAGAISGTTISRMVVSQGAPAAWAASSNSGASCITSIFLI